MNINATPRIDLPRSAGGAFTALLRLEHRIELDPALRKLVQVRSSQLNGCSFCIDMHWSEARDAGESEQRLSQLDAWAESPYFDERERAALALTESMTMVAETHVPDDVWLEAEAHFDTSELANLLFAIAAINAWNRLQIAARVPAASFAVPARPRPDAVALFDDFELVLGR